VTYFIYCILGILKRLSCKAFFRISPSFYGLWGYFTRAEVRYGLRHGFLKKNPRYKNQRVSRCEKYISARG
jgi:hypothetical protein